MPSNDVRFAIARSTCDASDDASKVVAVPKRGKRLDKSRASEALQGIPREIRKVCHLAGINKNQCCCMWFVRRPQKMLALLEKIGQPRRRDT